MWPVNDLGEPIEGVVYARVAYRMIERQYKYLRYNPALASEYIFTLANWVNATLNGEFELYFAAYAYHLKRGYRLQFIRALMVNRALEGYTHRQILMWSYKAKWFSDPPVSNTGVTEPATDNRRNAL